MIKVPPSRIWTSDLRIPVSCTHLQSSALPTELSVVERIEVYCRTNWNVNFEFQNSGCSRGWFRSTDLWVMGPARFLCATLLILLLVNENSYQPNSGWCNTQAKATIQLGLLPFLASLVICLPRIGGAQRVCFYFLLAACLQALFTGN